MQATDLVTVAPLTKGEAEDLTVAIQQGLLGTWDLVKKAYSGRVWEGMNYTSWQEWCDSEFDKSVFRLRLPQEERKETVASLRDAGLSIRAISSVTGLAKDTVQKDLNARDAGVLDKDTTVTGLDGKSYPAQSNAVQSRPDTDKAPAKEATVRPVPAPTANGGRHFDYDAPSSKPKGGTKSRVGKVMLTMTVTAIYEIDLDSVAYTGVKTLEAAAAVDLENAKDDPALFLQSATEDDADIMIECRWI